jgi:AbrB family looped-hinge helix DNA binding protein
LRAGKVKAVPKVSSKNQITIPVDVMREAGLEPGDNVTIRATGHGEIALETAEARVSKVRKYAGRFSGIYKPGDLDALRDEWER